MEAQENSNKSCGFCGVTFSPDINKIIGRLRGVVLNTEGVWSEIKDEAIDIKGIYSTYLLLMAAVTPVCQFVGGSILGPMPFFSGLVAAVVQYAIALGGVYLMAFIAQKLAANFGGTASLLDTFKLLTFAYFPAMAIGVVHLVPLNILKLLLLLGLFSLYALYLGIPKMTGVPEDKRGIYFITLIGVMIVVAVVFGAIVGSITAAAYVGSRAPLAVTGGY